MSSAAFFQSGAAAALPAGQPCNRAGLPSWQRSAAVAAALLPRRAAMRAAGPLVQGCQDGSAGLPAWQRCCPAGSAAAAQGCPASAQGCLALRAAR